MLTFRTPLIAILLALVSTIMCKQYRVLCTAGLEVFDDQNYLCKAFDDGGSRSTFSRWKCPKVLTQQAKGTTCSPAPPDPMQPVMIPQVTCRDVYTFWSNSEVVNGISCRTTERAIVSCTDMPQAAALRDCDPL
ncbi:uncharacterized protein MELLADRAFT_124129 [Melampsora larici-populina 98AG31]|uniref:Secreted protein n=1 Tax=Melampsora larici-populina (strain 98AG31 / pathotype 3-4-7) TaxID=747676 RepID=F4RWY1_MELLP|nr:uncharacterized protein MELLADRAFT_124129 [Melampsora larici-populina 98AG31]EGG03143.1 secreted protein [Melampsora larici-populina 98AG31]